MFNSSLISGSALLALCPRTVPGSVSLLTQRVFASNSAVSAKSTSHSAEFLSEKKSISKKTYAELPQRRLLASGEPAASLPSWNGGLEHSAPSTHADFLSQPSSKEVAFSIANDSGSASHTVADVPDKSRRKRPQKSENTTIKAKVDTREGPPQTPRKKRTKRLTVVSEEAVGSQEHFSANEDTADAAISLSLTNESPAQQCLRRRPRNQLAKEILENLAKFPHCILLTRVGQFYESYFDQAQEVSRLLSIKLTQRTWDSQRVWMCGFPLMHLDKHLKTLVQHHKRSVAMCEEFPRFREPTDLGGNSKIGFDRRVVRVLTPGTLIDELCLNPYENNYLLAISMPSIPLAPAGTSQEAKDIGLAWMDVSTGEFFAHQTTADGLRDHLARISPREVVLDTSFESLATHDIRIALSEEGSFISYITPIPNNGDVSVFLPQETSNDIVGLPFSADVIEGGVFSSLETSAIALLTSFLHANLIEHMPRLLSPAHEGLEGRMQIDAHTIKALEIREGIREGGSSGSLMSAVKRTVTTSGTRLLARWLCSPSMSLDEIRARHSLVQLFHSRPSLREDIVEHLRNIEDASRIVQRFLLGRGDTDDLSSIRHTIDIWAAVKSRIALEKLMEPREMGCLRQEEWQSLNILMARMTDLQGLARRISFAVEERESRKKPQATVDAENETPPDGDSDASVTILSDALMSETKWTIKPQYSPELMALHDRLRSLHTEKENLQAQFQRQYDAPSLTLRSSPNHGMHVHIAKPRRDLDKLKQSRQFIPIAETNSTKSYFNQAWFILGNSIFETMTAIFTMEKDAFTSLRIAVNIESGAIRRNARIFDELDVTLAFANLASEMKFVKPVLTEDKSYNVVNGRHPTVELGLLTAGRIFTPNSVSLTESSRLHIITGPNMAGKSTFLRQVALIAILAQTGSFIPADSAEIGLIDKVFSRVGAKDDLFRDRSTFMVEMLETADILKRATDKSLVIMDEVGRGTTVKDGLAIAFATIHHMYSKNRCRVLFATHFHEVADMLGYSEDGPIGGAFPEISFYCTDVDETDDGNFTYSHRLRPGVNRDSHGLKVALLAGMPPSAMEVAMAALDWVTVHAGGWIGDKDQLKALGQRLADGENTR